MLAILEQHWFFTDRWYHHVWYSVCLSFLELVGSFEGSSIPTLEFTVYSDFRSKLGLETSWVLEPRICGEIMQINCCLLVTEAQCWKGNIIFLLWCKHGVWERPLCALLAIAFAVLHSTLFPSQLPCKPIVSVFIGVPKSSPRVT